jgi:hypothetical protein
MTTFDLRRRHGLIYAVAQHYSCRSTCKHQQTCLLGFRTAFLVCAGIAMPGVFTSLVRGREGRGQAAA